MPFNSLGSAVISGTALQDSFFAFTRSSSLDDALADGVLARLDWQTGLRTSATTTFTLTALNIQYSTDVFLGYDKSDTLYGSNLNDFIVYNDASLKDGFGGFDSVEQFSLGGGDDLADFSARPSGFDYERSILINGDTGQDTIIGGAGKDTINGDTGNDLLIGGRGADLLTGGQGNDLLYGDDFGFNNIAGDDTLRGSAGNDTLFGGARTDRLEGGDDDDVLYGGLGGDNLLGEAGNDTLYGDEAGLGGNDKLDGGSGNDQLYGGGGDDELAGGSGSDLLDGGGGNDFLAAGLDDDRLITGSGNDTLDGGANVDTVVFSGQRSDYDIQGAINGGYLVTDLRGGSPDGTDLVLNVEFLEFIDTTLSIGATNAPPVITSDGGGDTANLAIEENTVVVTTVAATDPDPNQTLSFRISGGADAALFQIDRLTGALSFIEAPDFEMPRDSGANNVYDVVVSANDGYGGIDAQALSVSVIDKADSDPPVITSSGGGANASLTLAENLTAVVTVTASDPNGTIPTYAISGGSDASLFVIDSISGALSFRTAPDFEMPLDTDRDNIYSVTVQATDGQLFDEQTLSVRITDVNETGRTITGSSGNNTIGPTAINVALQPTIYGDTIYGLAGNDTIDGGAGADAMYGGTGNDVFYVDVFTDDGVATNDDQVVELANEGTDLVNAGVSYVLADNVENLTLTGSGAIDGTGNTLSNLMNGNSAANILRGGSGNDTLNGGKGDDRLEGGDGGDLLNAGGGQDTLIGGTGSDDLAGGDGDDLIQGDSQNDRLSGQSGQDTVVGGTGTDTLSGGAEADTFAFGLGETSMNATTNDTILDFVTGFDVIDLGVVNGVLSPLAYAEAAITTDVFADAVTAAQAAMGGGKSVVFIAAASNGWLFWDSNADGVADQSVLLKGLNTLGGFSGADVV
ncbi:hypothetical protein ACLNGM_06155 [Aureimonas phyllosphaerae]|uniref:hypothetical protein n=1 Tax=Aureimonas phyllosphaerae TaxID=1166078 RepID=UPI003A5C5247